ncbi:MAG: hypothetical protein AAFP76_16935 [Bacteroidota bacterium]
MKTLFFIFFGSIAGLTTVLGQEINQMDANGERHGIWQKKFPGSDQLRYEGRFEHGKEVGTFKFYCDDCKTQPMVVKEFSSKDNTAAVKYFTKKGKLVSEGKMKGKDRIGEWVYYPEKSKAVMTREFYVAGKLDGVKTTYYPNGQVTEELNYTNGQRQGANNYYSLEGVLLKKLQYINDELHGPAEYYDSNGNVTIKGQYVKGKKHGLWKYYKNGKVELEEIYPKPVKRN